MSIIFFSGACEWLVGLRGLGLQGMWGSGPVPSRAWGLWARGFRASGLGHRATRLRGSEGSHGRRQPHSRWLVMVVVVEGASCAADAEEDDDHDDDDGEGGGDDDDDDDDDDNVVDGDGCW